MDAGIQTFMSEAGEAGCYALCLVEIASRAIGRYIDPLVALKQGIERGAIMYNWVNQDDNDNFFVRDPGLFVETLIGGKWIVMKDGPSYRPKPGDHIIQRWEREKTGAIYGHFRLPDWDSLVDSKTVKYGAVASVRVLRRID